MNHFSEKATASFGEPISVNDVYVNAMKFGAANGRRWPKRSNETIKCNWFIFLLLLCFLLFQASAFDSFDSRRALHQYVRCHLPTDL